MGEILSKEKTKEKSKQDDYGFDSDMMINSLQDLSSKIEEIPDKEIRQLQLDWSEAKFGSACSQIRWIVNTFNGMYKEIEHADYMIKKSLKESKGQQETWLSILKTNTLKEVMFLRDKLFYDDEELYLYVERLSYINIFSTTKK